MITPLSGTALRCQHAACKAPATSRVSLVLDGDGFDLCQAHLRALACAIHAHLLLLWAASGYHLSPPLR